jgi:hypothetical protein
MRSYVCYVLCDCVVRVCVVRGCVVAWLRGCVVAWLRGCVVAWLHGGVLRIAFCVVMLYYMLCDCVEVECWGWVLCIECCECSCVPLFKARIELKLNLISLVTQWARTAIYCNKIDYLCFVLREMRFMRENRNDVVLRSSYFFSNCSK